MTIIIGYHDGNSPAIYADSATNYGDVNLEHTLGRPLLKIHTIKGLTFAFSGGSYHDHIFPEYYASQGIDLVDQHRTEPYWASVFFGYAEHVAQKSQNFPAMEEVKDFLVIATNGKEMYSFSSALDLFEIRAGQYYAIGCGQDFAIGILEYQKHTQQNLDPVAAITVICSFLQSCRMPVCSSHGDVCPEHTASISPSYPLQK